MTSKRSIEEDSDETSSEDECLSDLKKKRENITQDNESSNSNSIDSDVEYLPSVLVSVQVEEFQDEPLNYSKKKKKEKSKSILRKKNKKSKTKPKPKAFPCTSCDDVFNRASELKQHTLTHSRHKCIECGQCFNKAFSLKIHRRIHQKHEKCPVCDMTFNLKVHMTRHLNTHERTEHCESCTATFHTRQQLANHAKIHEKIPLPNPVDQPSNLHRYVSQPEDMILPTQQENEDSDSRGPQNYVKLEDLPHGVKCAIVTKLHKGRSIPDVCRLYNLTAETVNDLWEERDRYTMPKRAGTKSTKYMNTVMDTHLIEWFNNQRALEVQVSGKMLQDVAEAFAKECGFVYFNGSRKWLDRFKKRYNICLRGTNKRDYTNPSESKWKQHFFKDNWCDVRYDMEDDDIYTADEVGFYYNPSKGRIKKMNGKKFIQGFVKDRLSVFLCTNVTGNDKRRLLVCGTDDPLIRSHRDPDSLPVKYARQSQARFTTEMFEEYVNSWNAELQLSNKKALLILDRATIHSKLQLSNLKLVFVPWKATRSLMPIQNGIFAEFRNEFRKLILQEKAKNAIRGIDRNLTTLEACSLLSNAWERTSQDVINKAFVDIGYDVKRVTYGSTVSDIDEQEICNMLKDYDVQTYYTDLGQLEQYLTVDEELLTAQGTNCSVFGGNHRGNISEREMEGEQGEMLPICTEKPETNEIELLVEKARVLANADALMRLLDTDNAHYDVLCKLLSNDARNFKLES